MTASFQNSEKINEICKFLKFPVIPAENSVISARNFWDGGFSKWEFPVALI